MNIGLFPLICIVAWVPLIPKSIWEHSWIAYWFNPKGASEVDSTSTQPVASLQNEGVIRVKTGWFTQVVCGLLVVYVLVWNICEMNPGTQKYRSPYWTSLGYMLHIDQQFQMFGEPPKSSPWFVYEGVFEDGQSVDTFRSQPIDHQRPERVGDTFPNFHWRKFHRNLVLDHFKQLREPLLDYAVRDWNQSHDGSKQLANLRVLCYEEDIGPDYNYTDRRCRIWGEFKAERSAGARLNLILDKDPDLPF